MPFEATTSEDCPETFVFRVPDEAAGCGCPRARARSHNNRANVSFMHPNAEAADILSAHLIALLCAGQKIEPLQGRRNAGGPVGRLAPPKLGLCGAD